MERRELESAAARATYLRGLTAVPLGLLFLLTGAGNLGWGPATHPVFYLAGIALLAAAWLALTRQYNDRYGRVRLAKRQEVRLTLASFACFGAALIGGSVLDFRLDLAVSVFVVSFGLAMLFWTAISVGLRVDHLVVWGALIVIGLLPIWGGPPDNTSAGWVPIGVATIVAGLLDHHTLSRTFGPVTDAHVGS
jgi:hypothetical protein